MEERDRQTITRNLIQLVEQVDIDILIPRLLEKRVFSHAMIEKYTPNGTSTLTDCKTNLFLDIQQRGPNAFQNLVDSLVETGYIDVARALQPDVNIAHLQNRQHNAENLPTHHRGPHGRRLHQGTVPTHLPRYLLEQDPNLPQRLHNLALEHPNANISYRTETRKIQVKMSSERLDLNITGPVPAYRMGSKPKGYFLLINNIEFADNTEEQRTGAEIDEMNLTDLFEQLGYIVICYRNLTGAEMKSKTEEFAAMEEHRNVDSCIVAIMSHGFSRRYDSNNVLVGVDGSGIYVQYVIECFTNAAAPLLAGKPKIFIFQCCRGSNQDNGVILANGAGRSTATDGAPTSHIRSVSDMLIAYSTVPGYVSNRDRFLGAWFIEKICDVFMDHAHNTDIEDMLKMVDVRLGNLMSEHGTMQTSVYENRGFRCRLFFNPGLYDEQPDGTVAGPATD